MKRQISKRLVWLALLPLLLVNGCFPIELDVSPGGVIVISRQEGFFLYNPMTSQVKKIGRERPGSPVFARFSPDGKSVLTVIKNGNIGFKDAFEFYSTPLNGGRERMLFKASNTAYVRYSPDGKQLAYVRGADKQDPALKRAMPELHVISADGTGDKTIGRNVSPLCRWFADSKRILSMHVETKDENSKFYGHIIVVDSTSGQMKKLAAVKTGSQHYFDLSPDNSKVLFTALQAGKANTRLAESKNSDEKLFELDVTTGNVRNINKSAEYAMYSPDGKQVLIGTEADGFSLGHLKLQIADAGLRNFRTVVLKVHKSFSLAGSGTVYPGWIGNQKLYYFVQRAVYGTEGKALSLMVIDADGRRRKCVQPMIDTVASRDEGRGTRGRMMGIAGVRIFRMLLLVVGVALLQPAVAADKSNAGDVQKQLEKIATDCGIEIVRKNPQFRGKSVSRRITGKEATAEEVARYARLFVPEFSLYPAGFVKRTKLKRIVFCKQLAYGGQLRAAIPDFPNDTLYLDVNRGSASPAYQRKVIHHEYFHIVDYRDDGRVYRDDRWKALNPAKVKYGTGGRNAQNNGNTSVLTTRYPGFLNHYSTTGVEEDKAEVFANMIVAQKYVKARAKKDRVLRAKVARMKALLAEFCPEINEEFWKKIDAVKRPTTKPRRRSRKRAVTAFLFALAFLFDDAGTVRVSNTDELRRAVAAAKPGTRILIAPGDYQGGLTFTRLQGTKRQPIVLSAADVKQRPVFSGGASVLHLTDPAHVELRHLILKKGRVNGLNIDDGGSFATPAHHVVMKGVTIQDVGTRGNHDGIKLSGVDDFRVEDCTIERWGANGSGIDMVGCHRGVITKSTFRNNGGPGGNGVQTKGGSRDITIRDCRFDNAGGRGVNIGGSTGLRYFRPKVQTYEAKDIVVEGCTFIGSMAAVAFVGVDGAVVRKNIIYRPTRWVLRILQENRDERLHPSRKGTFSDNTIVFRSNEVRAAVNVGGGTSPETFTFKGNTWYCLDRPAQSRRLIRLPTDETGGTHCIGASGMWEIFVLLFVLLVVTLVGHGIWLLLAAMFGAVTDSPHERNRRMCPKCRRRNSFSDGRCRACGYSAAAPSADAPLSASGDPWRDAATQLQRLREGGLLSEDRYREMRAILLEEKKRVETAPAEIPETPVAESIAPDSAADLPVAQLADEEPMDIVDFDDGAAAADTTESREVAAIPVDASPAGHDEAPQRDRGRLLQAFMEEKNIRWGELVSGMLIVGSAIGLVISLWSTLQTTIPYFPALLFMLATASIHGAGLYTLRRWNLKSTSRGLLLISTLLIPLNVLAAIALSGKPGSPNYVETTDLTYLLAVSIGLLCYGAIAYSSSRVFRKRHWWVMWVAVMIPCAGQLVIARQAEAGISMEFLNLLAALPVLGFVVSAAAQMVLAARGRHFTLRRAEQTFQLLAIAAFSMLMAAGLLVSRGDEWFRALAELAAPFSVFAVLITATGLIVQQRATRPALAGYRTAGTAVALTGSAFMLAGLVLAWPRPELLIAVGIVDVVALMALAVTARLPVLHVPAIAAIGLTTLTAMHWAQGAISSGPDASGMQLRDALLMGRSGLVLLGLAGLSFLGSFGWPRATRQGDAEAFQWGAALSGALSLGIAFLAGFPLNAERELTTPIFAIVAVAAFFVGVTRKQPWAAWGATLLTFVAMIHAVDWNEPFMQFLAEWNLSPRDPLLLSLLIAGTAAATIGLTVAIRIRNREEADRVTQSQRVVTPLCHSAIAVLLVAFPIALFGGYDGEQFAFGIYSGYLFWITLLWCLLAATLRSRAVAVIAQAISHVAVLYAGVALAQNTSWWADNYSDPRYWQMILATQAGWCALWGAARRFSPADSLVGNLSGRDKLNVDHAVLAGSAIGAIILIVGGVMPGISAELVATGATAHRVLPPDVFSGAILCGLVVCGIFATAATCSSPWRVPLSMAGMFVVAVVALSATNVTAESYEAAIGVSHTYASGIGSWAVVALLLAALVLSFQQRIAAVVVCGAMIVGGLIPVLIAGNLESHLPTATTLRFGLTAYGILIIAGLVFRERVSSTATGLGCALSDSSRRLIDDGVRATGIVFALCPLFGLTLAAALQVAGHTGGIVNPATEIFGRYDLGLSYAIPFWLIAAVLLGNAITRRDDRNAIAASLLFQTGMVVLFLLPHWQSVGSLTTVGLAELIQWSGIGLGTCTLCWMIGRRRFAMMEAAMTTDPASRDRSEPYFIQFVWTLAIAAFLSVWALLSIVASPTEFRTLIEQLGHPLGLIAFGLALLALVFERGGQQRLRYFSTGDDRLPASLILVVPVLAAATVPLGAQWDVADTWLSYHALVVGWSVVLSVLTGMTIVIQRKKNGAPRSDASKGLMSRWNEGSLFSAALLLGGLLLFLGIRGQWDDPQRPWWLLATSATVGVSHFAFGLNRRNEFFAYSSTGLALLATIAAYSKPWIGLAADRTIATYCHLFEVLLVVLALSGMVWLGVEVYRQRLRGSVVETSTVPAHHAAAGIAVSLTSLFVVWLLFVREQSSAAYADLLPVMVDPLGIGVMISGVVLAVASLWDRRARHASPVLFVAGLAGCIAMLDSLNAGRLVDGLAIDLDHLWFALGIVAAAYFTFTAALWGARRPLTALAKRIAVAEETVHPEDIAKWLPWTNICLGSFAVVVTFWSVLYFNEPALRYAAAAATALMIPGLALFAQRERAESFRMLSLMTVGLAALQLAWAIPFDVMETNALWLQYTIRLLEVLSIVTLVYAVGLSKLVDLESAWGRTLRTAAFAMGGLALASLAMVLVMEGTLFPPGGVPITDLQIAIVSVILAGLVAGLMLLAVVPGRDPLGLSERGRTAYVYAAEIVGSLIFLHIYLTKQELFRGLLKPYWPFIVIGIAFVGVGLSEWFRRKKLAVLAEPLERSGTFLPLLPVLAFWLASSQQYDRYSIVLLLAGLLYLLLATMRKSFVYSVAAGILANCALWSMYAHLEVALLSRPQAGIRNSHKAVIMIYMAGAPSHQDMYDLKMDAPAEIRGEFRPIDTAAPGIQICEHMPKLAGVMDKCVPLRSVYGSPSGAHDSFICYTGRPKRNEPAGGWPSIGSYVSKVQGPLNPSVPPFIGLAPNAGHPPYGSPGHPGFLGVGHAAFRPSGPARKDMVLNGVSLDRLGERKKLLSSFDNFRRDVDASGMMAGMDAINQQAMNVLTSSRLAEALDLSKENPKTRARYGKGDPRNYGDGAPRNLEHFLMARRLVEAGARVVTLNFGRWDFHSNNFSGLKKTHLPQFDQGLATLIADLHERGLDKDVAVVAWGEFGRTPRINPNAGRDHWPQVGGGLIAGGGIKAGQVIGATDRLGMKPLKRPVHFGEVHATLYRILGIDAETKLNDLAGRPQYLVDGHQPMPELL
eukprot:g26633.t1